MMEILFVYALVLLFFLLTLLFVVAILAKHPYSDPLQIAATTANGTASGSSLQQKGLSDTDSKIGYALFALFMLVLCIVAVLKEKRPHT